MKISKLILLFALISYCATENDECSSSYVSKLNSMCISIDSNTCRYTHPNVCKGTKACSTKDNTGSTQCSAVLPPSFNTMKCVYSSTKCEEKKKECTDYDSSLGDICSQLYPGADTGKRCASPYQVDILTLGTCIAHFDKCEDFTGATATTCEQNIPLDKKLKCVWDGTSCKTETRQCTDSYTVTDKDICPSLIPTDAGKELGKKCIFFRDQCIEDYEKCEDYKKGTDTVCKAIQIMNDDKTGYNTLKECDYDATKNQKCFTVDKYKYCEDYPTSLENKDLCISLVSNEPDIKRCVYDYKRDSCKEEYKSCSTYNSLREKDKETCEKIILLEVSKRCVWNSNNQCVEEDKTCDYYKPYLPDEFCENIKLKDTSKYCKKVGNECKEAYVNCEAYKGKDKETCESITLENSYSTCILTKDSNCVEKTISCSEATTKDTCLNHAMPSNEKMQCIFYNSRCLETYKKCEYYDGGDESTCESIIQINGKKCYFTSKKCKSKNKICTQALTTEECHLIAKKGVTDPDTRICDIYNGDCKESYKYCSDYRGIDQSFCTNIKPYDETGENIDPTSKCIYDSSNIVDYYDSSRVVGCRRELRTCSYAGSNDILCEMISKKLEISSNNKKYCAFIGDSCSEQYQTCESYEEESTAFVDSDCTGIKPKNYLTHKCNTKTTTGKKLCVTEAETKDCGLLSTKYTSYDDYKYFCTSLKPYCSYESDGSCTKKSCSEYTFTDRDEKNDIRCKEIEVSDPNKICALKSDKSGCEEIDKEVELTDEVEEEKTEANTTDEMEIKIPTTDFSDVLDTTNLASTQENKNSDGSYLKGIPIIIAIICLLF